ncbi:MAG: NADH-quinone oxidoreductase subunit D [Aquificae bacterium]|nr:NADH-quinone oxidoreductase subunit D [Aquificota bacterium]
MYRGAQIITEPVGREGDLMILNWGVQHPASGPMRIKVWLDGETIVKVENDPGYVTRNLEKLLEYRTWENAVVNIERICFIDDLGTLVNWALAVEKLAEVEVPKNVQYFRVILAEVGRIVSHLIGIGSMFGALGVATPMMWVLSLREYYLDFLEHYSGYRISTASIVPGGLKYAPTKEDFELLKKAIEETERRWPEYKELFRDNPTLVERYKGVGVIPKELVYEMGLRGPVARASGVDYDVRKRYPYSSYEDFDFNVVTKEDGDAYSRFLVVLEEVEESVKILKQALEGMPEGDKWKVRMPKKIKAGEVYSAVEWARGAVEYFVVSDGGTGPYRVKISAPSFMNIWVLEKIAPGHKLADLATIFASLYICHGDLDR